MKVIHATLLWLGMIVIVNGVSTTHSSLNGKHENIYAVSFEGPYYLKDIKLFRRRLNLYIYLSFPTAC